MTARDAFPMLNMLQTTLASSRSQPSSQTVPYSPLWRTYNKNVELLWKVLLNGAVVVKWDKQILRGAIPHPTPVREGHPIVPTTKIKARTCATFEILRYCKASIFYRNVFFTIGPLIAQLSDASLQNNLQEGIRRGAYFCQGVLIRWFMKQTKAHLWLLRKMFSLKMSWLVAKNHLRISPRGLDFLVLT